MIFMILNAKHNRDTSALMTMSKTGNIQMRRLLAAALAD